MSGTSADAVDAALVRVGPEPGRVETLEFVSPDLPESLRARVHAAASAPLELRSLVRLDIELGERFADAALELLRRAGAKPDDVEGIGSHGQTLGHYPQPEVRGSLQVGSAAVIHDRTGIPVVSDFRSADLAAGGQGAPLTPFVHLACLSEPGETRAVLNLGGFTNLTLLAGDDPERVIGFDPGPGNALLDRAARWASGGEERYDAGGERGRRGRILPEVLEELLADAYFAQPPPKSTGHERFGAAWFERARDAVLAAGGGPDDVLATLAGLTVESVARAAGSFFPEPPGRWIVYGGGVRNRALFEGLTARLEPAPVERSDVRGIASDAFEAVAFAVLGWCAARGLASNLPRATGAARAVCLGSATPAGAFAGLSRRGSGA